DYYCYSTDSIGNHGLF
nr:immunoglobulin light chain junction region [Macaca mulatta]